MAERTHSTGQVGNPAPKETAELIADNLNAAAMFTMENGEAVDVGFWIDDDGSLIAQTYGEDDEPETNWKIHLQISKA